MCYCEHKKHSTSFLRWNLAFYYGFYVCSHCGKQVEIPSRTIKEWRCVFVASSLILCVFRFFVLDSSRSILRYLGYFIWFMFNFLYLYIQWKKECADPKKHKGSG